MNSRRALWEKLRAVGKKVEKEMDPLERKRTGSYYTDLELTDAMMNELVSHVKKTNNEIWKCSFLEPCVGTGNFVFSYLQALGKLGLTSDQIEEAIHNIYVADINRIALDKYKKSLSDLVHEEWNIVLPDDYFLTHVGRGLLFDVSQPILSYTKLEDVFPSNVIKDGFDIIATNPPYKNLKAENSQYTGHEEYEQDKIKYSAVTKMVSRIFQYSNEGVLNLYKLFVEEIVERYANKRASISLLIPASILSDKTCAKLRTHILTNSNLISVKFMGENNKFVDAQQSLAAILIDKGNKTNIIQVTKKFDESAESTTNIKINDVMNNHTGNAIISVTDKEYQILRQLRSFPVVGDLAFITNLRGELDLTLNKQFIVYEDTGYPLLRGKNIGYYNLSISEPKEFVMKKFIKSTQKKEFVELPRIVCQQIANIHKEHRVTFCMVPKHHVLGNSCNFITVKLNEYGITAYTLLGLFNTKIINWLFKVTSSNNHINNYEIDSFPIPIHSNKLHIISALAQEYCINKNDKILDEIEHYALLAYGIEKESEKEQTKNMRLFFASKLYNDLNKIVPNIHLETAIKLLDKTIEITGTLTELNSFNNKVVKGIVDKYRKMNANEILNHSTFKLSNLDLEMIKNVPQGGSWKDIPAQTVRKSKRLERITQTGGRTTLYGRIDYKKPSYTITTYFNRPGNGTYVHPVHERVLSVREAARFQSFPDKYIFCGNKTDMLKQVGNAVPVLLAFCIGKRIKEKTGCATSIDLFSGAGGMTYGFKCAGIKAVIANDIMESACITLKVNSPEIPVLCGDITDDIIKTGIVEAGIQGNADIICGGPPCQGFSMAGFRMADDPRNQLFKHFVDIVSRVNPKIIVFENVEGILSYQGGKTYRDIIELFSQLGYNTEGRKLMANDYGVPQRRKRVIILCTRKDLNILPCELFPEPITPNSDKQITAYETIFDLEGVACNDDAKYISPYSSSILEYLKGKITAEEYSKMVADYRGGINVGDACGAGSIKIKAVRKKTGSQYFQTSIFNFTE